jgi:hypothetical protein
MGPLVLLVMLGVAGSWIAAAVPAQAASGDPDVVPLIECSFLDTGTGLYNTVWGYSNQTQGQKNDLSIPVGPSNAFDNPGQSSGQPTVFKPRTEHNAFVLTHKGSSTWTLTTYRVTAPGPACATNPVPIVSSSSGAVWAGLLTIAIVTGLGMGFLFWQMRRARRT